MRKILFIFLLPYIVFGQTIADISSIVGIRENKLLGYGLVVGLPGTGDKSKFSMQSLQNLLRNSYIKIPTSSIKSKNIATVMVTATLPAFARQGDKIKINISSIGDAKSINHGELLLTQLKGPDGKVYALGQGNIIANDNNPAKGVIYEGATIENELNYQLYKEKDITISLLQNSAKTASNCETRINETFGQNIATALDTKTIKVLKPLDISVVTFLAQIQNIKIDSDIKKKIIIDINKEMIIAGSEIIIQPITVTKKNFIIRIKKTSYDDLQWEDLAVNVGLDIGDDVKIGNKAAVVDLNNALLNTKELPTISDLMRAMKVMKLSINDIISTIQMLDKLGAIDAQMEIIR